jgi:predicted ATPase
MILTPDQRLRVFVSSTLGELAEERQAVRQAIESLRLTPVLFELAARPHAPASLYRAYLGQSHVFVGVYWQQYGWIAPTMEISGLEDEYRLSSGVPRLLYVKEPAPEREPRLQELIGRIEAEGKVSYKRFSTPAELGQVVKDDLVTLLIERFAAVERLPSLAPVPAPAASIVGRDQELARLADLLVRDGERLVTLTGPGGVGKSRLAIEAARALAERYPDGVFFVPLEPVDEPARVPAAVSRALGLAVAGAESDFDAVRDFFARRKALLYLDNFEHVAEAASFVADLLAGTEQLAVLVTSRAPLRVRGEHELAVEPLEESDAVRLFRNRARSVRGRVDGDPAAASATAGICRSLDCLPLAIELAAARTKLFAPSELLTRLGDRLDLVGGARRDLPERHQTLRSAIAWSYELLDEDEQALFIRLGAFSGPFTLEAVEAICADVPGDTIDGLSSLIDKSLVRTAPEGPDPGLTMLETIRHFAAELLASSPGADEARAAHARYYVRLSVDARAGLRDARQGEWHARLAAEVGDLEAAFDWWLEHEDAETMADVVASLWVFWWLDGYLQNGRVLVERILERRDELSPVALGRVLSTRALIAFLQADYPQAFGDATAALEGFGADSEEPEAAWALATLGILRVFATRGAAGREELTEAARMLEGAGDRWGAVRLKNGLHWALLLSDKPLGSDEEYRAVLVEAEELASPQEISMAAANLGRYYVFNGAAATGLPDLLAALEPMARMRHKGAIAAILDSLAEATLGFGDFERGVRLLAAATTLREAISAPVAPVADARNERNADALRQALGAESFDRAWSTGAAMLLDEALTDARALVSATAGI